MYFDSDEDEMQEIRRLNGQTVISALESMKNNATEREVSNYIIHQTGQPNNLVIEEVKRVLHKGISNGFIVKIGNNYTVPSLEDIYHMDTGEDFEDEESDSSSDDDYDMFEPPSECSSTPRAAPSVMPACPPPSTVAACADPRAVTGDYAASDDNVGSTVEVGPGDYAASDDNVGVTVEIGSTEDIVVTVYEGPKEGSC